MSKSVLIIDTPNSCDECVIAQGKVCLAMERLDVSPCKILGKRHSGCPLKELPKTIADYIVFNEKVWEAENETSKVNN